MRYQPIGSTGVIVSELGFGCAPLGNLYGDLQEAAAHCTVHAALDAGITLFDTSIYYGEMLSEAVLGRALAGRRDAAIISTKAGRNGPDRFDYSRPAMLRSLESSLQRLKTDYVDIMFAHDIEFGDPRVVLGECYESLLAMKRDGLCRAIGMSALPLQVLRRAIGTCELDVIITYCHGTLNDDAMLNDLLPLAQERGVAVINASPTSMGLLTEVGPQPWHPAGERIKQVARAAATAATAGGHSISRTSLSWTFRLPGVVSTLIGAKNETELASSLEALATPPDSDALALLQSALAPIHNMTWPSGREAGWLAEA